MIKIYLGEYHSTQEHSYPSLMTVCVTGELFFFSLSLNNRSALDSLVIKCLEEGGFYFCLTCFLHCSICIIWNKWFFQRMDYWSNGIFGKYVVCILMKSLGGAQKRVYRFWKQRHNGIVTTSLILRILQWTQLGHQWFGRDGLGANPSNFFFNTVKTFPNLPWS